MTSISQAARAVAQGAAAHTQTYRPQAPPVQPQTAPDNPPPTRAGGAGSGAGDTTDQAAIDAMNRFIGGAATSADLYLLVQSKAGGGIGITPEQAYAANAAAQKQQAGKSGPLDSLYPFNPQTGGVSDYPASSPIGTGAVESPFNGPGSGAAPYYLAAPDSPSLPPPGMGSSMAPNYYSDQGGDLFYNNKGSLLPKYLQNAFSNIAANGGGGLGGAGGGITAYQQQMLALDQQKFADKQQQDQLQNVLSMMQDIRQRQTLAQTAANNANTTLVNAGPNLAGGFQYYGGWQPGGPGPALAAMNGLSMGPVSTQGHLANLNVNPNPPPADPQMQALVDRFLNGPGGAASG